jgi:hypothetical protein
MDEDQYEIEKMDEVCDLLHISWKKAQNQSWLGEIWTSWISGWTRHRLPWKHAEAMKMNPEMEHYDPNATRVPPKKADEIVWSFTKAGEFEFACLIPGHRDAGMFGTVDVKWLNTSWEQGLPK